MTKTPWTVSDIAGATHIGIIEFRDNKGEWHNFEVIATDASKGNARLVFGGACNAGFLESGHIHRPDCETQDETLQEMLADLEVYYNDGPQYVSRIICNERM